MNTKLTEEQKVEGFWNGRIIGGYSLHATHDPEKCKNKHTGPWRTIDCEGFAGTGRDIIECAECGKQQNVACNFDEDFS